jgi:hypothetical protein
VQFVFHASLTHRKFSCATCWPEHRTKGRWEGHLYSTCFLGEYATCIMFQVRNFFRWHLTRQLGVAFVDKEFRVYTVKRLHTRPYFLVWRTCCFPQDTTSYSFVCKDYYYYYGSQAFCWALAAYYYYYYFNWTACVFTRRQWYYNKTQHTKIHISHKITHHAQTKHITQSYTNNKGRIAQNE